jgi:hypothetical protein
MKSWLELQTRITQLAREGSPPRACAHSRRSCHGIPIRLLGEGFASSNPTCPTRESGLLRSPSVPKQAPATQRARQPALRVDVTLSWRFGSLSCGRNGGRLALPTLARAGATLTCGQPASHHTPSHHTARAAAAGVAGVRTPSQYKRSPPPLRQLWRTK